MQGHPEEAERRGIPKSVVEDFSEVEGKLKSLPKKKKEEIDKILSKTLLSLKKDEHGDEEMDPKKKIKSRLLEIMRNRMEQMVRMNAG